MNKFDLIIQHLSKHSPEERGRIFEHYCKWFLENDPRYSIQVKKVWLWRDWPQNWGRDKGIDLIAETHAGDIWAIQAKAYDHDYYVTKEDIDKFLSETARKEISFRLLIASTDKLGSNAKEVIEAQEKPIAVCFLEQLEKSGLDWSLLINNVVQTPQRNIFTPRDHQKEAIGSIIKGFETFDRGQIHMACGTGKTLVGLWAAEELCVQKIVVLVPSISLVSQLYLEWANNRSNNFDFYPIFLCSDETVAYKKDDDDSEALIERVVNLGFPVTTNVDELLKQVQSETQRKIIFSTYHSSPIIKEACERDKTLIFDLVVADEAHRCAGKALSYFATVVNGNEIRARKKLFMTATPKFFSENVKKKTKEIDCEIVSMDDIEKFGSVFYKLPFSEAIKRDLLCDYQVLISVMDNKTYQEYAERGRFIIINDLETDARTLASQILILKAIKKHGLKKIISFHNKKSNAREFVDTLAQANELLSISERPIVSFTSTIFGEMSQDRRNGIIKQFKISTEKAVGLIANVKCLSEGVDVPALDGIAFIDPKGSEIDIIQSVGRAIRKSSSKTIGTIIIPILTDNITSENEYFEQSCFKPVLKILKALRAHDDTLGEELDNIKLELGKRTYKAPPTLKKIILEAPIRLTDNISVHIHLKLIEECAMLSLAQSHPDIALEWHPTKNGCLNPNGIVAGSAKNVWWICKNNSEHCWKTKCYSRTTLNSGCPYCKGKRVHLSNCLQTISPTIAQWWHPDKNQGLTPLDVTISSGKKVWWQCLVAADHEWKAVIAQLTEKRKYEKAGSIACPCCRGIKVVVSNCLATTHPELSDQWHPTKNLALTPYDIYKGMHKKAWWQCPVAPDHEWQASIKSRAIAGNKCPMCRGSIVVLSNCLATRYPKLSEEWHPSKNDSITPYQVHSGTKKKVWWQCSRLSEHEWMAQVANRKINKSGCPHCYKTIKKNQKS